MSSVRRIAAFSALWAAISAGALLAPGCYGRNCEGSIELFGADAGQGEMISDNEWQSGPFVGRPWLPFPRQRLYFFEITALGGRTPEDFNVYVSASPEPMKTNGDLTTGAGNIALVSGIGPNRIAVKNDTCSDYYLRLTIEVPPLPPAIDGGDGAPADAGIDAGDAEAGP